MRPRVLLGWQEVLYDVRVGSVRHVEAITRKRPNQFGGNHDEQGLLYDIRAAYGENAVAKFLDVYWTPLTDGRLADLPGDVGKYEVRTRDTEYDHHRLHPTDRDDARYVLALAPHYQGDGIVVELAGWILGQDGKDRKYWSNKFGRGAAYWVPLEDLQPMETLAQ